MSRLKLTRRTWARFGRYLYRRHSLRAIPTQVGLCVTHLCNIRCVYCMRETFQPPRDSMTVERVKKLMHRMPYVSGVCIMGLCEPLMNPQTPDIVRWLSDEGGYSTSLTTNGMIPLNLNILDALLRVDDMVFSIDTSDPETFRYLRGGADLNRVMENLERLLQFKRELGLGRFDNPPIHINAVITSRNFSQIPGLIKMLEPHASELTYLMVDPITRPDYQDFEKPLMIQRTQFEQQIGEYRRIAGESPLKIVGFDYMLEPSSNWRDCPMSWDGMFVQPNGDAYFCYNYEYVLGNVFQQNPLFVWNSSRAKQFRRKLLTSDPPLAQCHSCNFARKGWQPSGVYYQTKQDVISWETPLANGKLFSGEEVPSTSFARYESHVV